MRQGKLLYLNRVVFALAICAVLASSAFCVETTDPIRNGGGARPLGMGRAATAVLDDINAAYYNPAGLVGIKSPQFMAMYYAKVYGNYHYFVSGGATNTPWGIMGAGFITSGTGQIPVTQTGSDVAYAEYSDNLFFVSYADSLQGIDPLFRNVYFGTNLKLFSKATTGGMDYSATGYNVDLGLKYIPYNWLSVGLNKQNIIGGQLAWNTGERENFPSPLFLGAAVKDDHTKATYSFDGEFPSSNKEPPLYHFGIEYPIESYLNVRCGADQMYDAGDEKVFTNLGAGLGFHYNGIVLDYAYHPYYDDPSYGSHFVSLSFAGAYTGGITATAGRGDKREFYGGEQVDISVQAPFEAASVVAWSPNDNKLDLKYDHSARSWVASWDIPTGFKPRAYQFKVLVTDLEGREDSTFSNYFSVIARPEAPTIEVVTTPEAISSPEVVRKTEREMVIELLERYLGKKLNLESLVKRKEMAVVIASAKDLELPASAEEVTRLYTDIDPNMIEARYIEACYKRRAIIGYSDMTFRPDNNFPIAVLIAMMSDSETDKGGRTVMWQYLMKVNKSKITSFNDVVDAMVATGYLKDKYYLVQQ